MSVFVRKRGKSSEPCAVPRLVNGTSYSIIGQKVATSHGQELDRCMFLACFTIESLSCRFNQHDGISWLIRCTDNRCAHTHT